MRILLAGCWRSGTTAAYNLLRTICAEHGTVYACFEDAYDESEGGEHDFEIVKVHKFDIEWAKWSDVVFTVFREPADVIESMQRFARSGGRELTVNDVLRGLSYWGMYQRYSAHCVHFNELKRNPMAVTAHLAAYLRLQVDIKRVVKKWKRIRPPQRGYDPVTLLHHNHITKA